jgi:hypothetical protein
MFTEGGRDFVYYDMDGFRSNDEFKALIEAGNKLFDSFEPDRRVLTITNVSGVIYDTETKKIVAEWMKRNVSHVIKGAVIGLDGLKKIMCNAIFKISGRTNMKFCNSKEDAIAWLLEQADK